MQITSRESESSLDDSCYERGSSTHLSPLLQPTTSAYGELCLNGNENCIGQATFVMGAWQDGGFIGHFSLKVRENQGNDVDSDFSGNWEAPLHLVDQIFEI
ncbi:hypothetical protein [Natronoglycomyces albus]|uniref:Uncharacterized protein n=1 Tax=Natronoglycomyces albus TaxID=2811108 RepID=A0A895XJS4_9ACTN|nr:hypothetical protein [Natronoglycomyces albus]QSB04062.1 hypothetical protein JQS30_09545 [Natronoglycomyces albus]